MGILNAFFDVVAGVSILAGRSSLLDTRLTTVAGRNLTLRTTLGIGFFGVGFVNLWAASRRQKKIDKLAKGSESFYAEDDEFVSKDGVDLLWWGEYPHKANPTDAEKIERKIHDLFEGVKETYIEHSGKDDFQLFCDERGYDCWDEWDWLSAKGRYFNARGFGKEDYISWMTPEQKTRYDALRKKWFTVMGAESFNAEKLFGIVGPDGESAFIGDYKNRKKIMKDEFVWLISHLEEFGDDEALKSINYPPPAIQRVYEKMDADEDEENWDENMALMDKRFDSWYNQLSAKKIRTFIDEWGEGGDGLYTVDDTLEEGLQINIEGSLNPTLDVSAETFNAPTHYSYYYTISEQGEGDNYDTLEEAQEAVANSDVPMEIYERRVDRLALNPQKDIKVGAETFSAPAAVMRTYKGRKSPALSAKSVKIGTRKRGNDGRMWQVRRAGKTQRWFRD